MFSESKTRGVSVCNVARTDQSASASACQAMQRPDGAERQRNASAKVYTLSYLHFPFIKLLTTKPIFLIFSCLLILIENHFDP